MLTGNRPYRVRTWLSKTGERDRSALSHRSVVTQARGFGQLAFSNRPVLPSACMKLAELPHECMVRVQDGCAIGLAMEMNQRVSRDIKIKLFASLGKA
jgi:hypothetical protein